MSAQTLTEGLIKSLDCRKCGAKDSEGCKRFDKPELRDVPVVCPRECPPYYDFNRSGGRA